MANALITQRNQMSFNPPRYLRGLQTTTGRITPSTAAITTIDNELLGNPIMLSRNQQNEQLEILDIEDLDDVIDPTFSRSVFDVDNESTSMMALPSISELEMNFLTSYADEEEDEESELGIDDDFDDDDNEEEDEESELGIDDDFDDDDNEEEEDEDNEEG